MRAVLVLACLALLTPAATSAPIPDGCTFDDCSGGYVTASASLGPSYISLLWLQSGDACTMIVLVSGGPGAIEAPCAAGAPPNPGWGNVLP